MMSHFESPHEDATIHNLTNKQNYTPCVVSKDMNQRIQCKIKTGRRQHTVE